MVFKCRAEMDSIKKVEPFPALSFFLAERRQRRIQRKMLDIIQSF
jgi:hypothetical protein